MENEYLKAVWGDLKEREVHRLLAESLSNQGWKVKNLHDAEPRFEEGADLIAEGEGETWLIAVKIRPRKGDIKQLDTLSKRHSEGKLKYFYVKDPTEHFRKKMPEYVDKIDFGGMTELHSILVQGESIEYLIHVFGTHYLLQQMAEVLAILWDHRDAKRQKAPIARGELKCLWALKDACLKLRTCLCFASIRWDDELWERTELDKKELSALLDMAIDDLSATHRFIGEGLMTGFRNARRTYPQLLGLYWSLVRNRTYWEDFALAAERQETREDVLKLAREFWLVPNEFIGFRAQRIHETMRGFYSSIVGLFKNLANVATELERGVDWTWEETR